jgi:hypothetical protein
VLVLASASQLVVRRGEVRGDEGEAEAEVVKVAVKQEGATRGRLGRRDPRMCYGATFAFVRMIVYHRDQSGYPLTQIAQPTSDRTHITECFLSSTNACPAEAAVELPFRLIFSSPHFGEGRHLIWCI